MMIECPHCAEYMIPQDAVWLVWEGVAGQDVEVIGVFRDRADADALVSLDRHRVAERREVR